MRIVNTCLRYKGEKPMRTKNQHLIENIIAYINEQFSLTSKAPTMREIASEFNVSSACVWKYIKEMNEKGLVSNSGEYRGIKTKKMQKTQSNVSQVAIVGSIACGSPILAEQNIEGYISVSNDFLGYGTFFVLRANGSSMINAGISDGDYVVVRQQESAEQGQIVVALIDNETTLKRYYLDNKKRKVRLHPENDTMKDMYFDHIQIQGVAVKVIKDLV